MNSFITLPPTSINTWPKFIFHYFFLFDLSTEGSTMKYLVFISCNDRSYLLINLNHKSTRSINMEIDGKESYSWHGPFDNISKNNNKLPTDRIKLYKCIWNPPPLRFFFCVSREGELRGFKICILKSGQGTKKIAVLICQWNSCDSLWRRRLSPTISVSHRSILIVIAKKVILL